MANCVIQKLIMRLLVLMLQKKNLELMMKKFYLQ